MAQQQKLNAEEEGRKNSSIDRPARRNLISAPKLIKIAILKTVGFNG
jgi:hypothetical protein